MNKIFYHGSNKLFDKFDTKYSRHDEIFVSPCHCKLNSFSYLTRKGGYLYTIEIDDSNDNYGNKNIVDVSDSKPNEGLLCVKGKFGFPFIHHPERLIKPLIRKDGELKEAEWSEAIELIASKIKSAKTEFGPDALGGLSSARVTNEEKNRDAQQCM